MTDRPPDDVPPRPESGAEQPLTRDADPPPASGDAAPDRDYFCDLCGAPMEEWHCRIICNACGYQRDCSDP